MSSSWFKQGLFIWHRSSFKAEYHKLHNKPNSLYEHSSIIEHKITDISFENNKTNGDEHKIKLHQNKNKKNDNKLLYLQPEKKKKKLTIIRNKADFFFFF